MKFVTPIACFALLAPAAFAQNVEREADAPPTGEVAITNVAGDVHVIGWDQPRVQVKADLGRGMEELEFERRGDRTMIEVKWPDGRKQHRSVSLHVHVPQGSSLTINTVSASQRIDNVRGEQRLQSISGQIRSETWAEDFQAKTVSGEIRVTGNGRDGSARITTVSGRIVLNSIAGELDLNSVNGAIAVRADVLERVRAETTNGEMRIETALAPDARVDLESINGAVDLRLRGSIDAEFDIETFNGHIDNCFGPKPQRKSEHGPGRWLRFKEGKGSARVRAKTLNGAVELCRGP